MNFIVDIIIIAILLICTFLGYKKGLIGQIISVASFFVAIILAFMFYGMVANIIIEKTELDESIEKMIIENFVDNTENTKEAENMPEVIVNYIEEKVTEIKNNSIESSAKNVSFTIIKGISFIGIFIISKIIIAIIGKFADVLTELPILKQVNDTGGLLVGVLKGLIITYIILAVLSLIVPLIKEAYIYTAINNSIMGKFMYNHNLLLKILF